MMVKEICERCGNTFNAGPMLISAWPVEKKC